MAVNIAVVKTPAGTLAPATAYDAEILRDYAAGRQLKVEIKQMGNRSYQHHKLFFGGLLPLAYEYWYGWWRQSGARKSARCCKVWRLSASG